MSASFQNNLTRKRRKMAKASAPFLAMLLNTAAFGADLTIVYGGRLVTSTGAPVGGPLDLQVQFFHQATGGSPVGNISLQFSSVTFVDGLFQLDLKLSEEEWHQVLPAIGTPVFIEISNVTYGGKFPRQLYNVVPYALKVPVDGSSITYNSKGQLSLKVSAAPTANGQILSSTTDGVLSWINPPSGGGGGGISAVTAGTGLTGGGTSGSVTLGVDVGTSAGKIVQLDGSGRLPAVDGSALTGLDGGNIAAGTIANLRINWSAPGPIGGTTPSTGTFTAVTAGNLGLSLQDNDGTANFAVLRAATNMAANQTYTLPAAADAGKYLTTDASGNLSWNSPAGSGDMLKSTYDVDADNIIDVAKGGTGAANASGARTNLGLGSAAVLNAGTTAASLVQLDGTAKLPAVDASQLTGITAGQVSGLGALATAGSVSGGTGGTIADDTITNADIASNANIARGKLAAGSGNHVVINEPGGNISSEAQLSLTRGGTGANLSATGGAGHYLKQTTSGGAVSVGAIAVGDLPLMVGDSGSGGTAGLVPAPTTGDATKFLKGDGTWGTPSAAAGGSNNYVQINSGGLLAGSSYMQWNDTKKILLLQNIGTNNLVVGHASGQSIDVTSYNNTVLGVGAATALTTGGANTIIGASASTGAAVVNSTAIGAGAQSNFDGSIALGSGAQAMATNQMVVGSGTSAVGAVYIGNGVTNTSPSVFSLNATGGFGANVPGADLAIIGGRSTGSAAGGAITFSTTPAGGAGSAQNTITEVMRVTGTGNVGIGSTSPISRLANTNTSITDAAGVGVTASGLSWLSSTGGGYAGAFFNSSSVSGRNGLLVKTSQADTGTYVLKLDSASTTRMAVRADGNVGIGLTDPSQKLAVAGDFGILEGGGTPTYYTIFQGGDQSESITYTLPAARPSSNGQVLSSTTGGVMTWITPSGSGVTSITAGTGLNGGTITGTGTIDLANTAVTPGAYTRANITVDQQGRITLAANGSAVALATDVSGTLAVGSGGTGATSFTNNGVLLGSGSLPLSATAAGTNYQVLRIPGAGGAPAFGAIDISQSAAVTGILSLANGGTGANLSATGGANQFLKQTSAGGAVTVAAIAAADLPAMVGDSGAGGTKGAVPAPASGDAAANKYLKADGTWTRPMASISDSGGSTAITIDASNNVGIGDATPDGRLSVTPAANDEAIAVSGYSLTGSNAQSLVDLAGTWNTTGDATAFKMNITNTASGASSKLVDIQTDSISRFTVDRLGSVGAYVYTIPATGGQAGISLGGNYYNTPGNSVQITNSGANNTLTTGTWRLFGVGTSLTNGKFAPTSGTATLIHTDITPAVNTSGTYSGTTTGLRVSQFNESTTGVTSNLLLDVGTNSALGGSGTHTSRFAVTSAGNVGVGTAAPNTAFHVRAAAGSNLHFSSPGSNHVMLASFNDAWSQSGQLTLYGAQTHITADSYAATTNWSGTKITNGATSSTNAVTKAGLEISSTGTWNGTNAKNIGLYVSAVSGGTNNYDAIFNGGGRVGIGNADPWDLMHITGTGAPRVRIESTGTTQYDGAGISLINKEVTTNEMRWDIFAEKSVGGAGTGGTTFQIRKRSEDHAVAVTPISIDNGNNLILLGGYTNGGGTYGNVSIGTDATPTSKLVVAGAARNYQSTSNATTTINFSTSNLQYTTQDCQTFNLHNLKDGGSYTFAVQGTNVATCAFNAYSDAGTTSLTMHLPPDHGATTSGKHTIYTFVVLGTHAYAAWTPGY